ncbi:MAG TPA: TolC family protein [Verrucomicrobiae bacterium]|nr:TolC family protein [Verrucomicrobiae bacterium]
MKKSLPVLILVLGLFPASAWAMARKPPMPAEVLPAEASPPVSFDLWKCYEMALNRSETVGIQKLEVARARAAVLKATGEAIGDVDFVMTDLWQEPQGGGGGEGSSVGSTLSKPQRRENRFEYSQPLFQGGRSLGALTGAGSLKKQRIGEWQRSKQVLFMDTVNAFYDYLKLSRDIEIISGILKLYGDRVSDLKEWEKIGRSRASESATARSQLEIFQADLADTKGDLAVARDTLAYLTGVAVEPSELQDEKELIKPGEEDWDLFEVAHQRPDVEAARQAVTTARGALIVAQSEFWPDMTLDVNHYEHREGFQSGITWDALVTLRVPLGKGGTTFGDVLDNVSRWKQAKLVYSQTERQAQREIQDANAELKSAMERYGALDKAVHSAQENFDLQKDEYQKRLVTNIDVLSALQTLFETQRDANEAYYDAKKNYWKLEVAKGELTDTPHPAVPGGTA